MNIQIGDTVKFSFCGVIDNAEVLRVNGEKLLLMIDTYRMCTMPANKVIKVS